MWVINFSLNVNPIPEGGYIVIEIPIRTLYLVNNFKLQVNDFDYGFEY